MDIHTFIANYQEAFGQHAELPIAFWYSDRMGASTEKVTGCLFKCMKQVRDGKIVSLSNETITCGGGKFYTGFTEARPGVCLLEREIQEDSRNGGRFCQ